MAKDAENMDKEDEIDMNNFTGPVPSDGDDDNDMDRLM